MAFRLYNTLSRSLQEFEPLEPGTATVYACGPTVYQLPHIGNYRTFVFNDLLYRYLKWKDLDVRFVMNLTDVDDKTIDGALRQKTDLSEFTAPVIEGFFADLDRLGVQRVDAYPRATQNIDRMIGLVERLVERGLGYVADDGSVYYSVSAFDGYGKLSGMDPDEMRAGAGLAAREGAADEERAKADPRDFVLWKSSAEADREVGAVWDTPWGPGRPGWHLECSVMSMAELGETFDIHTGGEDLVFPHHEDEIAQSEGATGNPFVRYWLHVKHLLVDGEKMSKSQGNDYRLDELIDERGFSPAAVRYLLLSTHYRKKLNFTFEGVEDAGAALRRLLDFEHRLQRAADEHSADTGGNAAAAEAKPSDTGGPLADAAARGLEAFEQALDDDLNVSAALAAVFDFVRDGNSALDAAGATGGGSGAAQRALDALSSMDEVLGVLELEKSHGDDTDAEFDAWVDERIEQRNAARDRRDFETADRIRDELEAADVVIEDTPQGTRWRRD